MILGLAIYEVTVPGQSTKLDVSCLLAWVVVVVVVLDYVTPRISALRIDDCARNESWRIILRDGWQGSFDDKDSVRRSTRDSWPWDGGRMWLENVEEWPPMHRGVWARIVRLSSWVMMVHHHYIGPWWKWFAKWPASHKERHGP